MLLNGHKRGGRRRWRRWSRWRRWRRWWKGLLGGKFASIRLFFACFPDWSASRSGWLGGWGGGWVAWVLLTGACYGQKRLSGQGRCCCCCCCCERHGPVAAAAEAGGVAVAAVAPLNPRSHWAAWRGFRICAGVRAPSGAAARTRRRPPSSTTRNRLRNERSTCVTTSWSWSRSNWLGYCFLVGGCWSFFWKWIFS